MIRSTHLICSSWKSCCRAVSDAASLWLCRRWVRACCRSTTCRRTTATWCSRPTATAGRPLVCSPVHCPQRECAVLGSGSSTAKTLTLVLVHCPRPAGTRYPTLGVCWALARFSASLKPPTVSAAAGPNSQVLYKNAVAGNIPMPHMIQQQQRQHSLDENRAPIFDSVTALTGPGACCSRPCGCCSIMTACTCFSGCKHPPLCVPTQSFLWGLHSRCLPT